MCVSVFRKSGCRKTLAIGKTSQTIAAYPKPARRRRKREVKHKQNPTNPPKKAKNPAIGVLMKVNDRHAYIVPRVCCLILHYPHTVLDYSTLLSLSLSRQQIIKSYDNDNIHKKPVFIPCVRLSNL